MRAKCWVVDHGGPEQKARMVQCTWTTRTKQTEARIELLRDDRAMWMCRELGL